jgi:uracil-DNA glycosylase
MPVIQSPQYKELRDFVSNSRKNGNVYPEGEHVMRALDTPIDKVKVVILGQDPYHGKGQANGLAFATNSGLPRPPSLRNIMKELQVDIGEEVHPQATSLLGWAKQGVLLLNTSLTVEEGRPGSHSSHWEFFTDAVIRAVAAQPAPKAFMLWGAHAKAKRPLIGYNHLILESGHPSPLSVLKFYGCRHFTQANQFLRSNGVTPIEWALIDLDKDGNLCRWNKN